MPQSQVSKLLLNFLKSLKVKLNMFSESSTPLCLSRAEMLLMSPTSRLLAFFLVFGLAMPAQMPSPLPGDTSEYLRILSGLKAGNLTLKANNVSASIPWTYNSQGIKFQKKLKEGKNIINFKLSKCQSARVSQVNYSLFSWRGYAQISYNCRKSHKHKSLWVCIYYIPTVYIF